MVVWIRTVVMDTVKKYTVDIFLKVEPRRFTDGLNEV